MYRLTCVLKEGGFTVVYGYDEPNTFFPGFGITTKEQTILKDKKGNYILLKNEIEILTEVGEFTKEEARYLLTHPL